MMTWALSLVAIIAMSDRTLFTMCGMQTGLGIPKLVDAADQNSSFLRLYCYWATAAASVNLALITGTSQERAVV